MKYNSLHEASVLNPRDCLSFFPLDKQKLDQPIHSCDDYELSLVLHADGIKLSIGNNEFSFGDACLLLTAPGLPHAWNVRDGAGPEITGMAIRFPDDLLSEKLLGRNHLAGISKLLQKAKWGLSFSRETIEILTSRIFSLGEKPGLESLIGLLSLLHELSISPGTKTLSSETFIYGNAIGNHRMDSVFAYMKANYSRSIFLDEIAEKANMTRGAFCRFIRKRTGKTYVESLNEIRIAHICRMLVETSDTVSEIAYQAGFASLAYFHRSFKKHKGCTPKEYREKSGAGYKIKQLPQPQQARQAI